MRGFGILTAITEPQKVEVEVVQGFLLEDKDVIEVEVEKAAMVDNVLR
jgi:hypothetical protein